MAARTSGPSATAIDLRPLTTSQLIDRGFALYRQNFAGLFLLALLCQIAPLAMNQAVLATLRMVPAQGDLMERPLTDLPRAAVLLGVWILSQLITFAFGVVITAYLADAYLGRTPSIKDAFRQLRSMFKQSVWTSLINIVLIGLTLLFPTLAFAVFYFWAKFHPPTELPSLIVFFGGMLVLLVGSLAPVLIVFMRLMLTIPAVALERLSGWTAVKRSSQLVRYDPGLGFLYWGEMRLSFLLLPLFVIEILALFLTSLPVLFNEINEALRHGSIGQITTPPESALILSQVLVLLSGSLLLPLYVIATTVFYYDVRIRREGFDIAYLAEQVAA